MDILKTKLQHHSKQNVLTLFYLDILYWAFSWILVWFHKPKQEVIITNTNAMANDEEEIKLTLDRNGTNQ